MDEGVKMIEHVKHQPWTRRIAAGIAVAAIVAAVTIAVSPGLAASTACRAGVSPDLMTSPVQGACGVTSYPPPRATLITTGQAAGTTKDVDNYVRAGSAAPSATAAMTPAACPANGRLPTNSWAATKSRLLPSGAVGLRVCRYTPSKAGGLTLSGSHLLASSAVIARDARVLDALPRAHGTTSCPADDGSEALLLAAYKSGRHAAVKVGLSGCLAATNGHLHSLALAARDGEALAKELSTVTS
jgi:hypothetical protein